MQKQQFLQYIGMGNVFFMAMSILTLGDGSRLTLGIYLAGAVIMTPIVMRKIALLLGKTHFSLTVLMSLGLLIFVLGFFFNRPVPTFIPAPELPLSR